jgi:hypothetical protein
MAKPGKLKNPVAFCLALFLLLGCKLPASSTSQEAAVAPQSVFTEAAQADDSRRLQATSNTLAPGPTKTPTASKSAFPTLLPTATLPLTVTQIATLTALATRTYAPIEEQDRAEFLADVTVADGTVFQPGEAFIKTWKLVNTGGTTWTTDYKAIFIEGELMGGPFSTNLPRTVLPEQGVDISVDFTAPSEEGNYRGYWKLQNADGEIFGLGSDSTEAFWVDIVVSSSLAGGDGSPTRSPDVVLEAVTMQVDNETYSGACPHTFVFTAQFVLNKPATVSFNLEADNDAGIELKLPPPVTRNLEAGNHSTRFEFTFAQTLKGWLRLRFTAPEDLTSNRANFDLTCQ